MLVPRCLFAAELTFRVIPNEEINDTTTLVEIRIDPQSKQLNVVEGEILFSGTASDNLSVQVENGRSVLSMWPTPPQYDINKKSISFTGGVPFGFNSEGLLFRLRLSPRIFGVLSISYIHGNAYLNDGKGTKEFISSKSLDLNINNEEQNQIHEARFNSNIYTYAIIILSVAAVLMVMFRYGLKKNDTQ